MREKLNILEATLKIMGNGSFLKCSMTVLCCFAAAITAGPAAIAAANQGVDVNDVSILFPEPRSEQELGKMLRADTLLGNGQAILPAIILEDLLKSVVLGQSELAPNVGLLDEKGRVKEQIALPGSGLRGQVVAGPQVQLADRSRWAVVSVRFDYGFPGDFVPESERTVQLRLVLQPIPDINSFGFAADASLHLLFDFAKGDSPAEYANAKNLIAKSILSIKEEAARSGLSTTGKGLDIHPVVKAQGLNGPFNAFVNQALLQLLEKGKLTSIATMIADNGVIPWFFFSGRVSNGRYQPLAQTFNETNSLFESFLEAVPAEKSSGAASPEFTDLRPQTNDFLGIGARLDSPVSAKGVQTMGLIQDPHFGGQQPNRPNALNHLSCSTCHTATARQLTVSENKVVVPQLKDTTPDNKPTNFIAQGSAQDQAWNVRNFGYFLRQPSIALRTLNESVLVAAETNRILNLTVQGTQCLNLPRYISCLGTQLGVAPSAQTCFVKSCQ